MEGTWRPEAMGTGERNDEWGLYRGMKSGSAGPGNRRGSDKLMDGEKQTEASLKVPGGLMGVENAGGWVWVFLKKQNIDIPFILTSAYTNTEYFLDAI